MAHKKAGNIQTNKPIQPLSKRTTWWESMQKESLGLFPGRDEDDERLIYTLYMWSDREDALELEAFCDEYGIWRDWLWERGNRSPAVKKAIDRVKIRLAHKRRMGCLYKKLDNATVFRNLWRYDPEEAENDEREDSRKIKIAKAVAEAKAEAGKGHDGPINFTVTFPDSDKEKEDHARAA